MGLYVLECDDSQANVLDNNDWDTNSPPATWTESLTCGATGDTSIYQGTRRNTHFKGMLPGLLCQENVFFIFLFLELGIHVIEDFKIISPPQKKKNWLAFLNSGFFQPLYSTLRQCLFTSTVIVRKL